MCQGCDDLAEFEAIVDKWLAEMAPIWLAKPIDHAILYSNHHVEPA